MKMRVDQLIEELKKMPNHAEVAILYDGGLRNYVEVVWEAREGDFVGLGAHGVVYNDEDRPKSAPSEIENRYWKI